MGLARGELSDLGHGRGSYGYQSIALAPDVPDTGTVRGDIEVASAAAVGRLTPEAFRVLPRLIVEAGDDAELQEALDQALLRPRRAVIGAILRRGVGRGELRPDLDVDLVVEMLIGPLVTVGLTSGADQERLRGLAMRVFDVLDEGIGARRGVA